ncbi:MAG: fluoride efflux transporter CrcB [Terrimicrobiaceae bacterium]|nr:fluoride efflux transporter CrcB [Terrimicrobiaceae bacterium]
MLIQTYLAVMAGGAIGTALRFALSEWIASRLDHVFPLGTLVVNITGCYVIGLFAGLTGPDGPLLAPPILRQTVMIGVLGGYTTFSSFSLQTLNLAAEGEWLYAGANIVLSVLLCLLGVWLGSITANALTLR